MYVRNKRMESPTEPRWGGFLLLVLLFSLGIYLLQSVGSYEEVRKNWPKYRCLPHIMPFASIYGANTTENFQFCMKNMFSGFGGEMLAPFYDMMGFFTKTLMGLLNSINSMRVMMASLVGGINTVFSEFAERLSRFFFQIKITANRMRQLMNRVVGIMFSVMWMGMSGVTAATNFGDSVMFKFVDTFCFAPETLVNISGRGMIPISSVKIGDVLIGRGKVDNDTNTHVVTGCFKFAANGQAMRSLQRSDMTEPIIVSTNHYVSHENKWIEVVDHPDSIEIADWTGGNERPLICLNTNTHEIPIGGYVFSDYDETDDGDHATMQLAENRINNTSVLCDKKDGDYSPCLGPDTMIKMNDGSYKCLNTIYLGDIIANSGRVIGIVEKEIDNYIETPDTKEKITPSILIWDEPSNKWVRAGSIYSNITFLEKPMKFIGLFVTPHSCIETASGSMYRDYIELISPDMRNAYSDALSSAQNNN